MNDRGTLLLLRLDEITHGTWCGNGQPVPVPEGWSALAVSGGMPDFLERKRVWDGWEWSGPVPHPTPFFADAPAEIVARVIWALTGPGGRLYPIYKTSKTNAVDCGIDVPEWPFKTLEIIVSPKLGSRDLAASVPWAKGFFTCWSHGLALGFWGDQTKIETRLSRDPDIVPVRMPDGEVSHADAWDEKMEEAHPHLWAGMDQGGYDWLLDNVPIVLRPCGWEGMDAVFLTKLMSLDEMAGLIRREFQTDIHVVESAIPPGILPVL